MGLGAWLSIAAFACISVQLQVVDDGSSATSPESESGPAKSLRHKGEFEPQLCMIYMLLKQTNAKIIIITLDNDSSFVSLRHSRDSQNNQAGRQHYGYSPLFKISFITLVFMYVHDFNLKMV